MSESKLEVAECRQCRTLASPDPLYMRLIGVPLCAYCAELQRLHPHPTNTLLIDWRGGRTA